MTEVNGQTGAVEEYEGRGVWVPHGLKASWVMEGASALESRHQVTSLISRAMVRDVPQAVMPLVSPSDISELSCADFPVGSGDD